MKHDETIGPLLETLQSVMSGVSDPAEVLRLILDSAVSQTDADRGVFVKVEREGELDFRVLHRMKAPSADYSRSVFQDVIKHKNAVRLDNATESARYADAESVRGLKLLSLLCVPIVHENEVVALVHLEKGATAHFTPEHQQLVTSLLEMIAPTYEMLGVVEERDTLREETQRTQQQLSEERSASSRDWSFARYVGRAPIVRDLEATVMKNAGTDFPVLLLGESGTGKGVLARILHHASPRNRGPFVTVFCPSLEKGLVESELFGHVRGAFTGADADREGKVEAAAGGTLFLDEIGELPADIQAKILRLLQEKTFERRGETRERQADVRIVAATNRDLEHEVDAGNFRRDLYERLNFLPVHVPPLREHPQDIPLLLRDALDRSGSGRWVEWDDDVEQKLVALDHLWPGNVRQIEQLAARLSVESSDGPLDWETVRGALGGGSKTVSAGADLEQGLPALMRQSEKKWLQTALSRYPDLSRKEVAERLRISEATLYSKLKSHGLT